MPTNQQPGAFRRGPRDLRRRLTPQDGVSLVEALVVAAIIAVTVAVAIPAVRTTMARYRTKIAATQLSMDIRFARNACVKKKTAYTVAINDSAAATNPNTYTISASGIPTISRVLPVGVNIATGSITEVDFQSLGNCTTLPSANTARNIDLTGQSPYRYRLTVAPTGNVSGAVY